MSFFFFWLNKYLIFQKTQPESGEKQKIGLETISNKDLKYMRRQIGDGNRPKAVYKSCLLSEQMCGYITKVINKIINWPRPVYKSCSMGEQMCRYIPCL